MWVQNARFLFSVPGGDGVAGDPGVRMCHVLAPVFNSHSHLHSHSFFRLHRVAQYADFFDLDFVGAIYLMRAVTDGRIDLNDEVRRHLDLCLDCRACESACPSGVQYGKLIEPYRIHMAKTSAAASSLKEATAPGRPMQMRARM